MKQFSRGDRVRVDIPDVTDPDHEPYHGEHGMIIEVLRDEADSYTGDERDRHFYRVELDTGDTIDLRWRDLRPPLE